jgi:hypothetical protein
LFMVSQAQWWPIMSCNLTHVSMLGSKINYA